jgi:nuclear pore complex protein Nup98-Nup96
MSEGYDMSDEESTSSIAGQHLAAEHDYVSSEEDFNQEEPAKGTPGGVLRARMRALKESAGPANFEVADGDDWAEMLKKTVSPAKRDRRLLKELNDASPTRQTGYDVFAEQETGEADLRKSSIWKPNSTTQKKDSFATNTLGTDKGRGFATSIDLMNSLFERPKPKPKAAALTLRASTSTTKGFPQVGTLFTL